MTLKFAGWPWKTIGHLIYATSSFVHHFIAISEFKLELQAGNGWIGYWPLTLTFYLWRWPFACTSLLSMVISPKNFMMIQWWEHSEQGKSEGFESCDRPIVRKRPIWVKIGDVLYRVTLKFDGWPWKTKGHLSFAVWSFVQHFKAIGEFKLELQSGNGQFGSNSTIFRAVWPWNLTYDLEKQ